MLDSERPRQRPGSSVAVGAGGLPAILHGQESRAPRAENEDLSLPPARRRCPAPAARLGLAALWIALAVGPAGAATFTVTNTTDTDGICLPADCSLREAIKAANNAPSPSNVIDFDPALPGGNTITLTGSLPLDITKVLLIDGTTATNLTVEGDSTNPLFQFTADTTVADVVLRLGRLEVADDSRLKLDLSEDQTLSEVIADASAPVVTGGQLEKLGPATLILLGANTYSGGTTVTAGTLQGNALSLQGAISLAAGTALVFDQATFGTFNGDVTGSGSVEKSGELGTDCSDPERPECYGTLFLSGSFTHTGGTTVTSGVLLTDPINLPGDVSTGSTGAIVFNVTPASQDRVYAGRVSGTGILAKIGPGTLTLTGANAHTGGTVIAQGTLQAETGSLQGNVVFGDDPLIPLPPTPTPTLTFLQDSDGTFAGDITDNPDVTFSGGIVEKEGAGTLTLVGLNTYGGGTFVRGGALQGDTNSLQGTINLENDAGVRFDQSVDSTFDGQVNGTGWFEKLGEGRLTLTQSHFLSGPTTVSAGRLDIIGDLLNSDVQVDAGAVFGGTGDVSGGTITADGTVAPGTSIGTLTAGEVIFNDGSVFEVEVTDAGDADLLAVTTAVIDTSGAEGVDVEVIVAPGNYDPAVVVDILTATTSCSGSFNPVSTDLAFFDTAVSDCSTNTVSLTIGQSDNSFEQFAKTENQTAVAVGLDAAEDTATGDLDLVYQNLKTLTVAEVPPALDAIGGEQLSEFPTTRLAIAGRFHRSIHERVRGFTWRKSDALFSGGATAAPPGPTTRLQLPAEPAPRFSPSVLRSAMAFGALGAGVSLAPDTGETGPGAWLDGYGIFGNLDGGANASAVDYTIAGTSLGVDGRLAKHWVVGGAAGYARSIDLDFKRRGGSGDANTFQGALYAGRSTSRSYLSATGRFAYSDMNTSRTIVFADIDRRATANFGGWDAGVSIEGGVNLVERWGVAVQPLASFDYVHVETDGYSEKGADSLDLRVKSESLDSMISGLGLRLHGTFALDRITWITPEVRLRWAHEFGDRDREIRGVLPAAATGGAWLVRGATSPADGWVVGAGWTVTTVGNLHVFADYDAILNQDLVEHSLAVGIRLEW